MTPLASDFALDFSKLTEELPCRPFEYVWRLRAALTETGWGQAVIEADDAISIVWEEGMPDDLIRSAHAVAHGTSPKQYRPCAWCYENADGPRCADGECQAPAETAP